jgi:hypothetical protein
MDVNKFIIHHMRDDAAEIRFSPNEKGNLVQFFLEKKLKMLWPIRG